MLETLGDALTGNDREEHIFALTQGLELYDIYQAKVADCDVRLKVILDRLKAASDKPMLSTTAMAAWSGAARSSAWITPLSITVAGPLLTDETSLILYVLRTCPVRIRFEKRRELPI
jgi:hypothetical protein